MIWARVRTGQVGAPLAVAVLGEADRLKDRLEPVVMPTVTEGLLAVGVRFGPAAMRELRVRILARYGPADEDEVQHEQDKLTAHAFLSAPQVESGGLTRYSLGLTPEQATRLEAAIGPRSAPAPPRDCSLALNDEPYGDETAAAPTPDARHHQPGPEPTTSPTGPTADPPTSPTPPSYANATTPTSTSDASGPTCAPSPMRPAATSTGTPPPAATTPTTANNHHPPEPPERVPGCTPPENG